MKLARYPMLRFADGVDWQQVKPELLQKMNELAARAHKVIDVFSGYRSDAYSSQVGGFAGDPHTRGVAVDANVNGKPVGDVIPLSLFKKVGLESGNQPNFYNGKPDPAHVQMPGAGTDTASAPTDTGSTTAATADTGQPQQETQPTAPTLPKSDANNNPIPGPAPDSTTPAVLPPGSGPYAASAARWAADTWNRIASQPGSSPDAALLAAQASLAAGG